MTNVAYLAIYWSSSPYGTSYAYDLFFYYDGSVGVSYNNGRSSGFSLRCVQE